jgi:hypothetical protein
MTGFGGMMVNQLAGLPLAVRTRCANPITGEIGGLRRGASG